MRLDKVELGWVEWRMRVEEEVLLIALYDRLIHGPLKNIPDALFVMCEYDLILSRILWYHLNSCVYSPSIVLHFTVRHSILCIFLCCVVGLDYGTVTVIIGSVCAFLGLVIIVGLVCCCRCYCESDYSRAHSNREDQENPQPSAPEYPNEDMSITCTDSQRHPVSPLPPPSPPPPVIQASNYNSPPPPYQRLYPGMAPTNITSNTTSTTTSIPSTPPPAPNIDISLAHTDLSNATESQRFLSGNTRY